MTFTSGDRVRVISGPFESFDGIVANVDPQSAKLRVAIDMFGRQTLVELEERQLQPRSQAG